MNDTYVLLDNSDFDKSKIPLLDSKEKSIIFNFGEISRFLSEIKDLFYIFRCNRNIATNYYTFYYNDFIVNKHFLQDNDFIVINTLVVNFLSSGKTLVESIESFINFINDNSIILENPLKKDFISNIYDNNFSYRLAILLRNYSQHGHLPVTNTFGDKYCFNLTNILNTPHFNFNKKMKNEIDSIIEEIKQNYKDHPRIALTNTLSEFSFCIHKIYTSFLKMIEPIYYRSAEDIDSLIKKRPEIIFHSDNFLNNSILLEDENSNIHSFFYDKDAKTSFHIIKNEAIEFLNDEKKELKHLRKAGG